MSSSNEAPWVVGVTARAPSNIAVIKYWGKRDEARVLPLNGSVSVTLHVDQLSAETTVAVSPAFTADRLWLNGKEVPVSSHRYESCLAALRSRASTTQWVLPPPQGTNAPAAEQGSSKQQVVEIGAERWQQLRVHVVSANNFPTAAGLASSAAGFACLVFALAELMGVKEAYPGELSAIARMGSGSACRSLYGGFVTWDKGELPDGTDSMARQVKAEDHWSDLVIIIAVVEEREKDIGSSDGMKRSAQTSALLQLRAQHVVPGRITAMEAAIAARDFPAFARLTCADSNQFHATCLDTAPPIFYLNATSRRVIGFVEEFNAQGGQPRAAYTFDAGPNAVMFVERQNATAFLSAFLLRFPPPASTPLSSFLTGDTSLVSMEALPQPQASPSPPSSSEMRAAPDGSSPPLKYILLTRPGPGPRLVSRSLEGSQVNPLTGFPL
ncbi:hypothetical protein CLOM_g10861 [Closterium sp. NIES-68]|nr:hypothetical protein CLOM_g10861 [Closterium sp. NIES-68]GJP74819.1 hypothetical protein CLOP_g5352 [Closterium sp. NIES-67]